MLHLTNRTVLALAPHIDDVELGAGGTIHQLVRAKNNVYYIGLSKPPAVQASQFLQEFEGARNQLGISKSKVRLFDFDPRDLFSSRLEILQLFYDLNKELQPDLVLTPSSDDVHQSHQVVTAECKRAFKYTTILGYEMPWNTFQFSMDVFNTLESEDVDAKVSAINAYATQKERVFFSNEIVGDLARVRGKQIGREYAECFEAIRLIL